VTGSTPSRLRELADLYIKGCNDRDPMMVAGVFSDQVEYYSAAAPLKTLWTHGELLDTYERLLARVSEENREARISSYLEDGSECAFEIESAVRGSDSYSLTAIDRFTLGPDNKVVRFAAGFFGEPPRPRE